MAEAMECMEHYPHHSLSKIESRDKVLIFSNLVCNKEQG